MGSWRVRHCQSSDNMVAVWTADQQGPGSLGWRSSQIGQIAKVWFRANPRRLVTVACCLGLRCLVLGVHVVSKSRLRGHGGLCYLYDGAADRLGDMRPETGQSV